MWATAPAWVGFTCARQLSLIAELRPGLSESHPYMRRGCRLEHQLLLGHVRLLCLPQVLGSTWQVSTRHGGAVEYVCMFVLCFVSFGPFDH